MSSEIPEVDDPRLLAGVEFLRKTGATEFKIGFTDEEDPPVAWYAKVGYSVLNGRPVKPGTEGSESRYEVDAAMDPVTAVLRLCEQMGDGAECAHCGRPTGFDPDRNADTRPLDGVICWYQYDPGAKRFIRGCA